MTGQEAIAAAGGDVLVEMTPTNLIDGEPGTTHIKTALQRGMEVVSANKGPLVLFYRKIHEMARRHHCGVHMSAATAAALPTLDVGTFSLRGASILSIEGILNGTTNYILSRMTDDGCRYDEALREAQELGIAETRPDYDVEGTDTANKIILIANRLLDGNLSLSDITVTGITRITVEDIDRAREQGRIIKLIGSAHRVNGTITLTVAPRSLDREHPLASVNGPEKAVTYTTDTMGNITVMGGKSSPLGAAAAVLKDMINAFMKKDSAGSQC
jgi:homoserine dehydrogenase